MLLFHFSFSVLVCLLLEWNLPTASETVCLYPSSAPPPNNLSAHVGLFQYFLSVQPIYYFFCHLRCGNTKQADSFPKWACSCPARSPRWAKFAVAAQNRNRPRAGAARPGSKLAHRSAGASCGPERERNPTRRTGSASFSSPRFASAVPPHPPSRRLTWQRPCPPPASARRAPLQRPSHADLGPVARRCASGIAPSRPSLPPAAPRRRGCLTTVGTPAAASPEQDCVSLPPSPLHLYGVSLYRRCCVPCLTQRRRSAPYGGVCWLPVPPRSSPGLIRRHVSNLPLRFMQRCWRFDVHWPLSVSGRRACSVNGLFGQNCASECASDLV